MSAHAYTRHVTPWYSPDSYPLFPFPLPLPPIIPPHSLLLLPPPPADSTVFVLLAIGSTLLLSS